MGHLRGPITLNVGKWNQGARKPYDDLGFVVVREFLGTFNGHDVEVLTLAYEPSAVSRLIPSVLRNSQARL